MSSEKDWVHISPDEIEDPTSDLSDPKYVRSRKRAAEAHANTRAQVLRNIMASVDGREWVFELLEMCHIYQTSFNPDPLWMAKAEGERTVGLMIVGQIQVSCPEQYLQMMKEAKDRSDVRE